MEDSQVKFKIPPWQHQLEALKRTEPLPGFAFFWEMGTGKTGGAIHAIRQKMNTHKRVLRTLIFCPGIVCKNWKNEWVKHSNVDPEKVVLLDGTGAERLETFSRLSREPRIFITSYSSLLMPKLFQAFKEWKSEAQIYDESHRLKNHRAQTSKRAAELANPPCKPYVYILSGSPVLNSPMDVFQQFKVLDGGATFGDNFWAFQHTYFYDKNAQWKSTGARKYFPDWQIKPGAIEEINRKLSTRAMRVLKIECLDLPPLVCEKIEVDMMPEQARVYEQLKKEYVAFIGEQAVSANLAIVKALRLMQIASGFVSLDGTGEEDDKVTKEFEGSPKIAALTELLEEVLPVSKVLVWAVWKENYRQLRSLFGRMGWGHVEVHGGVTAKQKQEALERFADPAGPRIYLGHPGSGGIGVNLVNAPVSIFYSRTFSLEHSLQAESRNHRGGAEIHEKITRYDLVCSGTIEEEIVDRLVAKEKISSETLKSLDFRLRKKTA